MLSEGLVAGQVLHFMRASLHFRSEKCHGNHNALVAIPGRASSPWDAFAPIDADVGPRCSEIH